MSSFHLFNADLGGSDRIKAALSIAEGIREERKKREQTEKELEFSDSFMKSAHTAGRVSDEDYTSYIQAPATKKHSMTVAQMANIDQDFKEKQLAERLLQAHARPGAQPWQPDPNTLTRLQALGYEFAPTSPRSGQFINTRKGANLPEPGSAAYDDDGNQIGVWDAEGKITKLSAAKPDPNAAMQEMARDQELQSIDRQIADLQGEIGKGNKRSGPDWLPLTTSYSDQLRGLLAKRATLSASGPARSSRAPQPAPAAAPGAAAPSMDDITGQTALPGATNNPNTVAAPSPAPAAPVVNSEQDYSGIQPGQLYVDGRDGKLKRKQAQQQ